MDAQVRTTMEHALEQNHDLRYTAWAVGFHTSTGRDKFRLALRWARLYVACLQALTDE